MGSNWKITGRNLVCLHFHSCLTSNWLLLCAICFYITVAVERCIMPSGRRMLICVNVTAGLDFKCNSEVKNNDTTSSCICVSHKLKLKVNEFIFLCQGHPHPLINTLLFIFEQINTKWLQSGPKNC